MLGRNILKEVREKSIAIRKKMTDTQFFTSHKFKEYLEDMQTSVAGKYGRNKKLVITANKTAPFIAYTDNHEICINVINEVVDYYSTLASKTMCILGLLFHEIAHILFLDFDKINRANKHIERKRDFYPAAPEDEDEEILEEIKEAMKDDYVMSFLQNMIHRMNNVFADVHDERCICEKFPGLVAKSIQYPQSAMYEMADTFEGRLKEVEENKDENTNLSFVLGLILLQARFDDVKIFSEAGWTSEYVKIIAEMIDYIELGRETDDMEERYDCINHCIVKMWPEYIKPVVEKIKEAEESAGSGSGDSSFGDGEIDDMLSDLMDKFAEAAKSTETSMPEGKGSPVDSDATKSKEGGKSSKKDTPKASSGSKGKKSEEEDEKSESSGDKKDTKEDSDGESKDTETDKSETSDTDKMKEKSEKAREEKKVEDSETTEKAIERMKEEIAEEKAEEDIEKERAKIIDGEIKSVDGGSLHRGIDINLRRKVSVTSSMKEIYDAIAKEIIPVSKAMQRQIMQALKDRREGGKSYGEIYGKRFESKCIARTDGKYFSRTKLPTETPRICVGVLVDESGSMGGMREQAARKAAILFEDFTRNCNIPTLICGHSTENPGDFSLYSYVEFDKVDRNDKYRLADIRARSQNRDGLALKIMCERIVNRPEDVKMLIVISDGQPCDYGYGGSSAEKEMKEICKEYKRKGINIFAAAIGADKENIHRIYGDGFLDITDLNKLPKTMVNLIKKQITF